MEGDIGVAVSEDRRNIAVKFPGREPYLIYGWHDLLKFINLLNTAAQMMEPKAPKEEKP